MKKITAYKIEYDSQANNLSYSIEKMIEHGWEPLGGSYYCENERVFCQTLVKYEEGDEKSS